MNGNPELKKKQAAGGVSTMTSVVRRRAAIGARLDEVIDELGVLYGELIQVQGNICRACPPSNIPSWVSEPRAAELLRNRLAMELAEHSSGGGNQSVLGPVNSRETIAEVFAKDHAGFVVGGRS